MMKIPHLVQYQGSKRNLANQIIQFFPAHFNRLIEPFSGIAAISIACAFHKRTEKFLINDINPALSNLLDLTVNKPNLVYEKYAEIWDRHTISHNYYNEVRDEFNKSGDPMLFLYLLARCVKGAVRYNVAGEFNQSHDRRRLGTSPAKMKDNIFSISSLLKNKCEFMSVDYKRVLKFAKQGDLVYMDPPYQGVCGNKDSRYFSGIDFEEFVQELENLNNKNISYVISYDGKCGDKTYGEELPTFLKLKHVFLKAGRSSQATLLGRKDETFESLYLSPNLSEQYLDNQSINKTFSTQPYSSKVLDEQRAL
ncbi:TPA: DNA adenine methylase [Legionella pneumophila]|nr:DNA adenine methylase [Legionella pneumophila]